MQSWHSSTGTRSRYDCMHRNQRPSEAIRGHRRSSEVIRGHRRSSEVIRGHRRRSEAIIGIFTCTKGMLSASSAVARLVGLKTSSRRIKSRATGVAVGSFSSRVSPVGKR
jgi:hypothetical protein